MMDVLWAMDKLGDALEEVDGLRVFRYPTDNITPPFAMVGLPTIRFDTTHARGLDRAEFEVTVLVGKRHDRSAVERITGFIDGVKDAIDTSTDFETADVSQCEVQVLEFGGVEYLACVFDIWIEAGSELAP